MIYSYPNNQITNTLNPTDFAQAEGTIDYLPTDVFSYALSFLDERSLQSCAALVNWKWNHAIQGAMKEKFQRETTLFFETVAVNLFNRGINKAIIEEFEKIKWEFSRIPQKEFYPFKIIKGKEVIENLISKLIKFENDHMPNRLTQFIPPASELSQVLAWHSSKTDQEIASLVSNGYLLTALRAIDSSDDWEDYFLIEVIKALVALKSWDELNWIPTRILSGKDKYHIYKAIIEWLFMEGNFVKAVEYFHILQKKIPENKYALDKILDTLANYLSGEIFEGKVSFRTSTSGLDSTHKDTLCEKLKTYNKVNLSPLNKFFASPHISEKRKNIRLDGLETCSENNDRLGAIKVYCLISVLREDFQEALECVALIREPFLADALKEISVNIALHGNVKSALIFLNEVSLNFGKPAMDWDLAFRDLFDKFLDMERFDLALDFANLIEDSYRRDGALRAIVTRIAATKNTKEYQDAENIAWTILNDWDRLQAFEALRACSNL